MSVTKLCQGWANCEHIVSFRYLFNFVIPLIMLRINNVFFFYSTSTSGTMCVKLSYIYTQHPKRFKMDIHRIIPNGIYFLPIYPSVRLTAVHVLSYWACSPQFWLKECVPVECPRFILRESSTQIFKKQLSSPYIFKYWKNEWKQQ